MDARDEILNAQEVAGILKSSVSFVYALRSEGSLAPRFKFGTGRKGWRWSRGDVEAYIAAHEIPSPSGYHADPIFVPIPLTRRAG